MPIKSIKAPIQLNLFENNESFNFQIEELDKEYFESFSWALPHAFSDPLALCRFEEGDTFYDTHKGYYSPWSKALQHIKHSIQVTFPPRAVQKKTDAEVDSLFESNWNYPLELDLYKYEDSKIKSKKHIKTTQGALYTYLWKGDFQVFENNSQLPSPSKGKILKSILDKSSKKIKQKLTADYNFSEAFVMPYDKSNPLLKSKLFAILEKLSKHQDELTVLYGKADNLSGVEFSPTLRIVCLLMNSSNETLLYNAIKKSVYKPAKNKKSQTDNFRIQNHGVLLSKLA